jgi:hypothetical protein
MEPAVDLADMRATHRVAPSQPTVTIFGNGIKPIQVRLLDESFGGIGVLVPDHVTLGKEVDVELSQALGGIRSVALVRNIQPTNDGSRVGLEWKALALSRYLNDVLQAGKVSRKHGSLSRILPGGLSVMWKLYEGGRWEHILDSADRLGEEAQEGNASELLGSIADFKSEVSSAIETKNNNQIREKVRLALDKLILKCIRVIS